MTQNQIAFHNAKELERHNKAAELETSRHQRMQEALQKWSNALTNYQIAVNNAHYVRQDAETARSNRERERQNLAALGETNRSNLASENIRKQSNAIQAAAVSETSRHQKAMENIQTNLNESLIEKNFAEASYTDEKTKSEGVIRTYVLPSQASVNTTQSDLNRERVQSEYTNRFVNVMSGISSGAHAIRDLGGTFTDILRLGIGTSGGTSDSASQSKSIGTSGGTSDSASQSKSFWQQLEVQLNR